MLYDERKQHLSWSFYVVDHLPTMSNTFRYDTPDEAIAKYRELPADRKSAIGASFEGRYELDLIHRSTDNRPVLVTDYLRSTHPVWNELEIRSKIDHLITELNVQHQYDHSVFGHKFPSIAVHLDRSENSGAREPSKYFSDKALAPAVRVQDDPHLLSSVDEVFVEGEGWIKTEAFLDYLDNSRPGAPGEPRREVFVSTMNVRYKDDSGRFGFMDVSPEEFKFLREKTKERVSDRAKPSLSERITTAEGKRSNGSDSPRSNNPTKGNIR